MSLHDVLVSSFPEGMVCMIGMPDRQDMYGMYVNQLSESQPKEDGIPRVVESKQERTEGKSENE